MNEVTVVPLEWADEPFGTVEFPARSLVLRHGIGSGLSADRNQPGIVWALADRGPNLELDTAVGHYGWRPPQADEGNKDAKIMPRPDIGPYLARLRVDAATVTLEHTLRLTCGRHPVPGLPLPDGDHHQCEPAFDADGRRLDPHPMGMDTEGIAALSDGGFWLGEEYGPSLVRVDASGTVLRRLVPKTRELESVLDVEQALPALAASRHLNRGFEAVTATPSEDRLFLAFQSPLSHPDKAAFEAARHVRLWELDADGRVLAQYAYPLDAPETFLRDCARRDLQRKHIKLCELAAVGERSLLVLERGSETSKIYRVEMAKDFRLPPEHLDIRTRPTIEQLSGESDDFALPDLSKTLLFTSDDYPEVSADMEGLAPLSDRSLLIVSDNDFGMEDKKTRFFRLDFAEPLAG